MSHYHQEAIEKDVPVPAMDMMNDCEVD